MQSQQISELLGIIERQGSHLDQYRSVLDAQRQSNISLNADCERIQARCKLFSSTNSTRLAMCIILLHVGLETACVDACIYCSYSVMDSLVWI